MRAEDDFLLRYSRHILLPEIDLAGQRKLAGMRVLIVGMGGLGSPVGMYLATAGIGHLVLSDGDKVELSNLQRQIVHRQETLGQLKVNSAFSTLTSLNPHIRLTCLEQKLEGTLLDEQVKAADIVVDCSDNFVTRFAVNRACVQWLKPLVSGAAARFEGQLTVFSPQRTDSPCYHCLYQETEEETERACSDTGVFAPLVGVIGSMQAAEALKVCLGIDNVLCGRLLLFDAKLVEWRSLKLQRDPHCPVCAYRA